MTSLSAQEEYTLDLQGHVNLGVARHHPLAKKFVIFGAVYPSVNSITDFDWGIARWSLMSYARLLSRITHVQEVPLSRRITALLLGTSGTEVVGWIALFPT